MSCNSISSNIVLLHYCRGWRAAIVFMAMTCCLNFGVAVEAGIYSGVVESVSVPSKTIAVRIVSSDKVMTFRLSPTGTVTVMGKASPLDAISAGQAVSVTTVGTSTTATKIAVRNAAVAGPAPAKTNVAPTVPAPMATTPSPVTVATTPSSGRNMPANRTGGAVAGNQTTKVGDWPQYRGPNRDNISQETGLLPEWPAEGPALAWAIDGFGEGYSAVAVVGETIYTLGTRGEDEMLFAVNRADGQPKWATRIGRKYHENMGNGPRGTPTVDGEFVYGLSGHGDLACLRTSDGGKVWELNILEAFQGNNIVWGISESVLIDGDKLICTPGGRGATMAALDKRTGRPIWRSTVPGNPQTGYSSAIAVDIGNVRQYVNFVHTGVIGVRANDGTPLWGQNASANETANCSTPLHADNLIFSASGYGTGGALFRLASRGNSTSSEVVYTTRQMKNHHGGMVLLDGHLYGFDEQILTCLDLQTGQPAWQNRSVGKGSVTYADGKLYLRSEGGPIAMAKASPSGYEELGRFEQPQRSGRPAWAHPVVAGGRLYIRDQDKLLAYDIK